MNRTAQPHTRIRPQTADPAALGIRGILLWGSFTIGSLGFLGYVALQIWGAR